MAEVQKSYGMGLRLNLATEKAMMSEFKRLPGLKSSHVGLDVVTGVDEDIDFEDVLNGSCTT